MEIAIEFILNTAMVVLLSATVFYCWLLNRRIQVLQDSKSELASLLKQFDRSTRRASDTMGLLQKSSKEAGKSVQGRIEKAQYILDDLDYMMDRANKLADQMEAGIAIARQREKIGVVAEASEKKAPKQIVQKQITKPSAKPNISTVLAESRGFERTPVSSIARGTVEYSSEMIELKDKDPASAILENGASRESILKSLRQAKAGGRGSESAISSLQSLIERVAERTQVSDEIDDEAVSFSDIRTSPSLPSRSERELMKALHMQAE